MNRRQVAVAAALLVLTFAPAASAKVVNANPDELPPGCEELADTREIVVHGGREHAQHFHGAVFTFDERSHELPACTKLTVRFVNDDEIRHQWMVHGAYPEGFFLIEVDGPGQDTGTFITGPSAKSLMVHCGLPQHQQKGMKAEILVAGGEGHVPNILGISGVPTEAAADASGAGTGAAAGSLDVIAQAVPASTIGLAIAAAAGAAGGALLARSQRDRRDR